MIIWELLHPAMTVDVLGYIPDWLDDRNPSPAKAQLHANYLHGGGWHPFNGFTLTNNNILLASGDPPLHPLAQCYLRNELIVVYAHSWVAIIQPDHSFEVCRMD